MADVSIAAYLGVVLTFLFVTCVIIVVYYAEPGFPWHSYITLVLGYYAAFSILLIVPLDIAVVVYDRRLDSVGSYDYDKHTLGVFYDTFFTMVLVLGSFILVFEEYYNTDGYFTLGGRFASSFKRMCIDMALPTVAGVIILGILLGQKVVSSNSDALKLTAIIVTNTVYELGLMFLLGYALVEYPRSIWLQSDLDRYLLAVQQRAAAQFHDISEAQLSVSLAVSDVLKTKSQLSSYADPALAQAMDKLVQECPTEFRSERMGKVAANKQGQVTVDSLAQLRTRLNYLKDVYKMAQAKVGKTKLLAYNLEDIVAAKNNPNTNVIHWSLTDKDGSEGEYKYEIVYKPILLKIASVLCMVLSILSFLGVICSMTGVDNNVSVYYLAVHNDSVRPAGIVLFILITFGYTVYITSWSIFQIKLSANCELVPSRSTPEALSFNVRMIARLAAPLAFFYLGWIAENGLRTGTWTQNNAPYIYNDTSIAIYNSTSNSTVFLNETILISGPVDMPSAFSNFYQLQNIDTVQKVFGTIFPIILYIVMGLFLLNVFNRILIFCKLENYQFGQAIVTDEQLREGKRQLERHKKNTERAYRRGELKTFIQKVVTKDEQGRGFFSSLFTPAKKSVKNAREMLDQAGREEVVIKEPAPLKAVLEKKGAFKLGGGGWKEVYVEVRSPGYLYIFKDKRLADNTPALHNINSTSSVTSSNPDIQVLDLRLVLDFSVPDRKNKDNLELDLETVQDKVKLKFKTLEEIELWRKGLIDWKDYCVDYVSLYGGADMESGLRSSNDGLVNRPSNASSSGSRPSQSKDGGSSPFDLDSIQVDEGSDEEDKGVRPLMKGKSNSSAGLKSSALGLFGLGKKKEDNNNSAMTVHDEKPKKIEGWLEKKSHGKAGLGENWQRRYVRIDEASSSIVYAKSSDPSEKTAGSIDLQLVKDVTVYEKHGKQDFSRFNVDQGDKVYKFRASSEAEGQRWVEALNAWRDYFLLNM